MKTTQAFYKYVGSDKQYFNMFFSRLAQFCDKKKKDEWPGADAWKYDMEGDEIFMVSIENHLQPPPIQAILSKVNMGGLDDDVEVTGDLDKDVGGVLWMGSLEQFKKDFKKVGEK